jgi:hypothetical protein
VVFSSGLWARICTKKKRSEVGLFNRLSKGQCFFSGKGKKCSLHLPFGCETLQLLLSVQIIVRNPNTFIYPKNLRCKQAIFQFDCCSNRESTPVYSRSSERKKVQAFWLLPKKILVLGLLKSRISKKIGEGLLRKLDFKLFHYKARVQSVGEITTIATRNRCWM